MDRYSLEMQLIEKAMNLIEEKREQDSTDYELFGILQQMKDNAQPLAAEIEGGGHTWFYVCGECHGSIEMKNEYCRHCGRKIGW